ncbi:MAG: hypothetical protein R3E12_02370 [Candidatus Eisenbacteria bacterium]|uniref:Zinc ribbon domain-containing protein n=1 Tax=Eiseniibacteriota bacterium TaxID=2212470 RepID=A0A956LVI8_UNCEI|nr:hypothetical protein [Candidatus Eisenbacteria bacterium]
MKKVLTLTGILVLSSGVAFAVPLPLQADGVEDGGSHSPNYCSLCSHGGRATQTVVAAENEVTSQSWATEMAQTAQLIGMIR